MMDARDIPHYLGALVSAASRAEDVEALLKLRREFLAECPKLIGMAKSRGGRDSVRGALESVSAYLECRDPALEAAARDAIADLRSALRHAEGPPLIAATL